MVVKTAADCDIDFKTETDELFAMMLMEFFGEVLTLILTVVSIPINLIPFGHFISMNMKPEFASALAHISGGINLEAGTNAACTDFTLDGKSASDHLRTIASY